MEPKQLDLLNDDEKKNIINQKTRKPRPDKDVKLKDTDASSSIFGFYFQIVAGLIYTIKLLNHVTKVSIEGKTEDIEIELDNDSPIYIQAKSIQNNYLDVKDAQKATDALNTLINTSNKTKGNYSKLLYVVNFRNPLSFPDSLLEAFWKPSMYNIFERSFISLPEKGKNFINSRIYKAQKSLKENEYMSTIDYLNKDKLYISTILFGNLRNDQHQFSVLKGELQDLFNRLGIRLNVRSKIENIKNDLLSSYHNHAAMKNVNSNKKITKQDFGWKILSKLLNEVPTDFKEGVPYDILNIIEDNDYEHQFIERQSNDINVVNAITKGYINFLHNGFTDNIRNQKEFINKMWIEYKELFPIDEDYDKSTLEELKKYGTQMIMLRVLQSLNTIHKFKEGINLK